MAYILHFFSFYFVCQAHTARHDSPSGWLGNFTILFFYPITFFPCLLILLRNYSLSIFVFVMLAAANPIEHVLFYFESSSTSISWLHDTFFSLRKGQLEYNWDRRISRARFRPYTVNTCARWQESDVMLLLQLYCGGLSKLGKLNDDHIWSQSAVVLCFGELNASI